LARHVRIFLRWASTKSGAFSPAALEKAEFGEKFQFRATEALPYRKILIVKKNLRSVIDSSRNFPAQMQVEGAP